MIHFESLVISLPAHELAGVALAESVFAVGELQKVTLPPDLRTAVELILTNCAPGKVPLCVARPEMFTHSESLEWLHKKIVGVTEHLNLSDGATLKLIPGLRNHVFLYGLQSAERLATFRKLAHRAPELLPQFETQVNSFHHARVRDESIVPPPDIVMLRKPFPSRMLWFYPFYLNPHSIDDSVDHMLKWGEFEERKLVEFDRLTYVPLTDISVRDIRIQKMLCESIATTYFDAKHCLVIRLPSPGEELAARMKRSIECVRGARLQVPRARAANVFFVADDLSESSLLRLGSRVSFVLHQSFEFWRYTRRLYEVAGKITVHATGHPDMAYSSELPFLTEAFGRAPCIVPMKYAADESYIYESAT